MSFVEDVLGEGREGEEEQEEETPREITTEEVERINEELQEEGEEEQIEPPPRKTELYRAIYLILSGNSVRGSKRNAIQKCLTELEQHIEQLK